MVASQIYGKALLSLFDKTIDYDTDAMYGAILTNAYVPDQDAHQFWADVSANELVGTGYTAGGLLLTGKSITYDGATNTVSLKCADLTWTNTTWTGARYLVIYDGAGTKPLLCYVNFDADITTSGSPFTYIVPTAGIITGTVS